MAQNKTRTKTRRKYHRPEQVVEKLRQADRLLNAGQSVAQVIQTLGITEPTYHRWRARFGGMEAEEAKRLKLLEWENARLKKLLAERDLDVDILKSTVQQLGKA